MPRKILIVDDNELNRRILSCTLNNEYDIIEAENGKEALLLISKNYKILSAILLDIIMPVMDGYEVLQNIKENATLSQIPVIMVTGSEDEASRVRALSLGANDFITKPYNTDIIRHCLRNNIALRETASILNAIQKDKLTGIYNRETFLEKVTGYIKDQAPGYYTLSCLDIDNFKLINDQYGAVEGDRILRQIGRLLKAETDEKGGIAGRISADNFAVLYPTEIQALDFSRYLKKHNVTLLEQQNITFSIGRYIISDLSLPASAIYDRAYIAKQSVKGRYDKHLAYFDERMLERLVMNQQITGEMETALEEHQFEVWFQPQYNHEKGVLIGAEALVRWRHSQKGVISPGDFIPLFEQNGFIYELDKYVWREVCRYMRKWTDEGKNPLPVSVNISRYDLFRIDLTDVISGLIKEYNLPPHLIRLEITESAFTTSNDVIVRIVKKLIELGFTIEIDDFGSGYSSLNTLKNVPAQVVKLDMRFLEGRNDSHKSGNILESIVRMAKWIGMTVLAEGVEDINQADFLKSIGCTYVQGYLYTRPMPVSDYEALCEGAGINAVPFSLEPVNGLNYSSFWDPNSIDTMIFNNYSGGACIYEYKQGKIELIRVSDKYVDMVFGSKISAEELMKIDWEKHTDDATLSSIKNAMEASVETRKEIKGEYLFTDLPGCPDKLYLRSFLRVIASVGDRHLIYCVSENITAQRQAEKRELESEKKRIAVSERMSAILNNINSGVCAVALYENRIDPIFVNDRLYTILGCTEDEFRQGLSDMPLFVCPDDMPSVSENIEKLTHTDVPVVFDYRINRKKGSRLWIRQSSIMTRFADIDAPVRLSVIYDITAEKEAEIKADIAEKEQNIIINSVLGGIASYEYTKTDGMPDLRLIYFNDGFCRLFGYSRDEYKVISAENPMGLVFECDLYVLKESIGKLYNDDISADCIFRVHTKNGRYKWLNLKSSVHSHKGNKLVSNAIFIDVTERQETLERLRVREEEYRLAMQLSGNAVAIFDVEKRTLAASSEASQRFGNEEMLENVPYAQVREGRVTEQSAKNYIDFYEKIIQGKKNGCAIFGCNTPNGIRWLEAKFKTIFSDLGKPVSAVVSYADMTEQLEKEAAYKKWKQSLSEKDPETYALIRCGISRNTYNDRVSGDMKCPEFYSENNNFNIRASEYAHKLIHNDDVGRFLDFINTEALLSEYNKGKRSLSIDYREKLPEDNYRWLRMTVDMLIYPNSSDVEAFLMLENIDAYKRNELNIKALAENDPLTGVLNRATFAQRVTDILKDSKPGTKHAMLMLDIDGFKLVNDIFGHGEGDKLLIEIAGILRSAVRKKDLIGRLGGDEFLVFIDDIPGDAVAAEKAKQICTLTKKALSFEVHISGSVGISIAPTDGNSFETLYKKADAALYNVKENGKSNYRFACELENNMNKTKSLPVLHVSEKKRRILIVDDNKIDREMFSAVFSGNYTIEKAKDGNTALISLRHFGSSVSVVLLDLNMPGISGFTVLEKMQENPELQSIPVIIVSSDDERETCLKALKCGASDFITKPVDTDMLLIRVKAAIAKSDTERTRARSSYRELQSDENIKYKTVLEHIGTAVIEHDWVSGKYIYDSSVSSYIAGEFDDRKLWQIFLSDMVTDVQTVKKMQEYTHALAEDRTKFDGSMTVVLKTPQGAKHLFLMSFYKLANEFGLTDKLIITFKDTERKTDGKSDV